MIIADNLFMAAGLNLSAVHRAVLDCARRPDWSLHADGSASQPNPGTPWVTAITAEPGGGYAVRQQPAEAVEARDRPGVSAAGANRNEPVLGYAIRTGGSPGALVGWAEAAVSGWQSAGVLAA
ncbi:hypothetical protein [Radicibacter daui]|uniref:hypothetical protein n=1 Tax=Radicibacter daui TaxID=3064829 RepID=UPI004046CC2A